MGPSSINLFIITVTISTLASTFSSAVLPDGPSPTCDIGSATASACDGPMMPESTLVSGSPLRMQTSPHTSIDAPSTQEPTSPKTREELDALEDARFYKAITKLRERLDHDHKIFDPSEPSSYAEALACADIRLPQVPVLDSSRLSKDAFRSTCDEAGVPCVLLGLASEWRANKRWQFTALATGAYKNIKMEVSEDENGFSVKTKLGDFVRYCQETADHSPLRLHDPGFRSNGFSKAMAKVSLFL
jgi:hypothetical protein